MVYGLRLVTFNSEGPRLSKTQVPAGTPAGNRSSSDSVHLEAFGSTEPRSADTTDHRTANVIICLCRFHGVSTFHGGR